LFESRLSSLLPLAVSAVAAPVVGGTGPIHTTTTTVTVPEQYRRGDLVAAVADDATLMDNDSEDDDEDDGVDDSEDPDTNDEAHAPSRKRPKLTASPSSSDISDDDWDPLIPVLSRGKGRRRRWRERHRSPGYFVCRLAESVEEVRDSHLALVKVGSHAGDGVWRFGGGKMVRVRKSSLLCRIHPAAVDATITTAEVIATAADAAATEASMMDTISGSAGEGAEVVRLSSRTRTHITTLLEQKQSNHQT
jgi:hypothetical protein